MEPDCNCVSHSNTQPQVSHTSSEKLIEPDDASKLDGSISQHKLDECIFALDQFEEALKSAVEGTTVKSAGGKYKAVYDAKGSRWRICSMNSHSNRITSRKLPKDVMLDLAALDAGVHKSQLNQSNQPDQALKASARIANNTPMVYAAPTREGNYVGRGNNTQKRVNKTIVTHTEDTAVKAAKHLLESDCKDAGKLRKALASMVEYASRLKQKLGVAASKLSVLSRVQAAAISDEKESTEQADAVATLTRELIGQGYPVGDTGRTLRRHRLAVLRSLQSVCGPRELQKQYEVACSVRDLFKQNGKKKAASAKEREDKASLAAIKGIEQNLWSREAYNK